MSLRSLRNIKQGEEITVKYGPEYFGKNNIDCLCPHTQFHGEGTLVLHSRTRSEARVTGERGSMVKKCVPKKPRKLAEPVPLVFETCPVKPALLPKRQREVVGSFSIHQGKK